MPNTINFPHQIQQILETQFENDNEQNEFTQRQCFSMADWKTVGSGFEEFVEFEGCFKQNPNTKKFEQYPATLSLNMVNGIIPKPVDMKSEIFMQRVDNAFKNNSICFLMNQPKEKTEEGAKFDCYVNGWVDFDPNNLTKFQSNLKREYKRMENVLSEAVDKIWDIIP